MDRLTATFADSGREDLRNDEVERLCALLAAADQQIEIDFSAQKGKNGDGEKDKERGKDESRRTDDPYYYLDGVRAHIYGAHIRKHYQACTHCRTPTFPSARGKR